LRGLPSKGGLPYWLQHLGGRNCRRFSQFTENAPAHRLAWPGGFELSDPEKPPLEHGLTATEGRSAPHIHCRMDWTGVQVTLWQLNQEQSLIAKRSEMRGNSGHTSKANLEATFVSSNPPDPAIPVFAGVRALPSSYASSLRSRQKYSCIIHTYSYPSQPVRSPPCDFRVFSNSGRGVKLSKLPSTSIPSWRLRERRLPQPGQPTVTLSKATLTLSPS
jgi:hypothetical protein